jgi:hypothetical protein
MLRYLPPPSHPPFFAACYYLQIKKGGESVLSRFRGGFAKTLSSLFPDIGLDESKFDVLPRMLKPISLSFFFSFSPPFFASCFTAFCCLVCAFFASIFAFFSTVNGDVQRTFSKEEIWYKAARIYVCALRCHNATIRRKKKGNIIAMEISYARSKCFLFFVYQIAGVCSYALDFYFFVV